MKTITKIGEIFMAILEGGENDFNIHKSYAD